MKKNKNKNKKKAKNKKKFGFKFFLILTIVIAIAIFFWSSSSFLFVGMMPTLVAWVIDKTPNKNRAVTIGAMNFAGCFPFLMDIWMTGNSADLSFRYLTDEVTIVTVYGAAFLGYIINYLSLMAASSYVSEKAHNRIKKIEEEKKSLEKRWGEKVNGKTLLDDTGFPLETPDFTTEEDLDEEPVS